MQRKTLFGTADGRRFYHIPVEATHVPGTLVLRNLRGEQICVDPGWVSQFSLPEEEAGQLAAEQMAALSKRAMAARDPGAVDADYADN